jgi:antitoxin component HigA of HigAB toxin-antitoxin module
LFYGRFKHDTMNLEARKILDELVKGKPDMMAEINARVAYHKENKAWLDKSGHIAVTLLLTLDKLQLTKKDLAERMGVSPQQITKIVQGEENLTLQTITKLEAALGIELIKVIRSAPALKAIDKLHKKRKPRPGKS